MTIRELIAELYKAIDLDQPVLTKTQVNRAKVFGEAIAVEHTADGSFIKNYKNWN